MKVKFSEIASWLGLESKSDSEIDTLLTDSRNLHHGNGTLFFALNTDHGNGHRYLGDLYKSGVRHFVVNRMPETMQKSDICYIEVDDTLKALQTIGKRAGEMSRHTVAITGSRGKTTLKEWLFQLMEPMCRIVRSPRSYNSQIGVPLSLWECDSEADFSIIEAGISRTGEMEILAEIIQPETVIVTNIGKDHSEGFHSLLQKAEEKCKLASPQSVRNIIFNGRQDVLREAMSPYMHGRNVIAWEAYGPGEIQEDEIQSRLIVTCDRFSDKESVTVDYEFDGTKDTFIMNVADKSDLENAAAALAFMLLRGYTSNVIASRFAALHRIGTRLNVAEGVNECSIIHDSYTSDISSLIPAVDFMLRRAIPTQKRTLILSDILHETTGESKTCAAIARILKDARIDRFIGIGPKLKTHARFFPKSSVFFDTTDQLLETLSPSDFESEIILLKGAPDFDFDRIAEMLEARKHETVLEVNLDSIVANYNYFRSFIPQTTGIVAMVKASGYGSGSYEIAKTMQDCGAAYLAVAVIDEGIDLRRNGIKMPIMVMNPKVVNYRSMFANRLEPEIYSLEMLRDVIREGGKNGVADYPIHLKLDTGMHRMGLVESELQEAVDILIGQNVVRLSSMFSHLATADCVDMDDYTELQLKRFADMTGYVMNRIPYQVKRHVLNSAGILRFPQHHYDMVRLGIGLYGVNTLPPDIEKPLAVVSTLRTVIISIREWEEGETIGYGRKGVLNRTSRIATIPIGYADGMNRHFGRGNISVKINGQDAPTVGNICMDACMVDVTGIDCKVGDAVEIFGAQAPLQRLADTLDTIPYEILTSVSPRVKRVYYRE